MHLSLIGLKPKSRVHLDAKTDFEIYYDWRYLKSNDDTKLL